jgi:hypothetical protein
MIRPYVFQVVLLLLAASLANGCVENSVPTSTPFRLPTLPATPTFLEQAVTAMVTETPPTATPIYPEMTRCALGAGLRAETIPILLRYKDSSGLVMSASPRIAASVFPQLQGWIRVIGAPSLTELRSKAEQAEQLNIPYEALGYGLETGPTTPREEWQDVVSATQTARAICDEYGKQLVMGPGLRLMEENLEAYGPMAAQTDIWLFQTQLFQKGPPGEDYRREVQQVIDRIASGNPEMEIWAQISLPPDREPSAENWIAYERSISDLVDGAYIGAYTWERVDEESLLRAMDEIFSLVCGSG